MHRSYMLGKGSDPLCPLGFHPQVRFPTRCKRCYREFKDHAEKKRQTDLSLLRNDSTASSPNLSLWGTSQSNDNRRSWSSSTNLAPERDNRNNSSIDFASPVSWPSSPDLAKLEDCSQPHIPTVSFTLPKRNPILSRGLRTVSDSLTNNTKESFSKHDSLVAKTTRLDSLKEPSEERSKRLHIKELKAAVEENTNDVQYLIQLKAKSPKLNYISTTDGTESDDDTISNAGTETTDTTLVGDNEFQDQIEELKKEVDSLKTKCDRLDREKSDLLLRRLASMETTTSKTTATEVLKLQQRCNELQSDLEDLRDDKKSLTLRVKELEEDLDSRPTAQAAQKSADELRSKLLAAETLCEELMDENEDIKKELRELEEEMEELHDGFREDQAKEYNTIKKELEQTTKNCRILAFKLRKKNEKEPSDDSSNTMDDRIKKIFEDLNYEDKILELEDDLRLSNEIRTRLQKDLEDANNKLKSSETKTTKKKAPMLGSVSKQPSTEGKVSRESLTRGGSQEDPVQLLRDLQDSMEREADLREQLKFAEEEAQNLRKKVTRIEDDNESMVLQLKKMATKAKSRKLSPHRLSLEPVREIDERIQDDDPSELKLLLELNEQEIIVLRKKIEELEGEKDIHKKKIKELQEKATNKTIKKTLRGSDATADPKIKALEDEANNLRKRLTQQEKETERLQAELNLNMKRAKGMQKSKSLDLDQNTIDLKRQLQVIDQEASVLRTKVQSLESENEKMSAENKKLQLLRATRGAKGDKSSEKFIDKIADLEIELEYANRKIQEIEKKEESEILNTKTKHNDQNDAQALKIQLSNVENERDKLADTIKRLKEDSTKLFRNRTPKKPTDFTSKIQLRNMVIDLENEIGEMLVTMNNFENIKSHLESQLKEVNVKSNDIELKSTLSNLEEIKKKLKAAEVKLQNETLKNENEAQKYNELNNSYTELNKNVSKYLEDNKILEGKVHKINEQYQNLTIEKEKVEAEAQKIKLELKSLSAKEKELSTLKDKSKTLQNEVEKKEKILTKAQSDLQEKEKVIQELNGKVKNFNELEKQITEYEGRIKKTEKENKEKIKQLTNKLEKERDTYRLKDAEQSNLSTKWFADKKVLDLQIDELNSKTKSLETIISSKNTLIEQLEESVKKERENISSAKKDVSNKEINNLKDELNKTKAHLAEVESKLETTNKSKKTVEEKLKQIESEYKKEKLSLDRKTADLDIDLQNERKKNEAMKTNHDKENKNKELELGVLRNKIKSLELNSGNKKNVDIKQEYQQKIDKLESTLTKEKGEYDNLTAKYEILEEEHVVIKAKLVMEKELLTSQLSTAKQELETVETELNAIKDTYVNENDNILKDKIKLQDQVKSLEKNIQKGSDTFSFERERLKSSIEEKTTELDQIKKEYSMIHNQMEYMRKENEEVKKKLEDYSKLSKIQRNISADTSAMDKEIRQLRAGLTEADRLRKSDVAECKMRYDSQMAVINNEINSLQGQVTRFKRERDNYKHMLEGAQKTIGDLKVNSPSYRESRNSVASFDEAEETRTKIATLEQQISCMEDELSESRLEGYKVKTELVSERSSWEIKLSEMQSRVNELEEERILSSGRTKIPGLRTRMELAWQKEREEQQRLLQETSTLARDLRQTLFEVERERDKERLESKRKQEQVKKSLDEDQDENKRKINELQCDLLELRDAHAKLRTTNEKLRREREKHEKERDEFRSIISGKRRAEQEDDRRMTAMLEQVDTLIRLAPGVMGPADFKSKDTYTPTPPRRTKGPKSRESSPGLERRDYSRESSLGPENSKPQIQSVMSRLSEVTEEIRRYQKLNDENKERERVKKSIGMRRATSIEHDSSTDANISSKVKIRNGNPGTNLHRRSLSLEHTIQQEQNIWRNDDSMSSLQSLDEESNANVRYNKRDSSFDSRLSSGSTQSETAGPEKKKKGLMSKLKKLTKSRSIDDQDPYNFPPTETLSKPSSNSDMTEEKGSKKDLRERLTGIFKRGGSSSRSNSLERRVDKLDTSSMQRPLMPNGSNVLNRNSPGPEQVGKHSSKSSKYK